MFVRACEDESEQGKMRARNWEGEFSTAKYTNYAKVEGWDLVGQIGFGSEFRASEFRI